MSHSHVPSQFKDETGKIFIGGLSWDTSHDSLLRYFSRYGTVIDCVVMKNAQTGKSRGFGFVQFKDQACVEIVLSSGPHKIDGRQVDPKSCNPRNMNKGGKNNENRHKKVFIGGLPTDITELEIRNAFEKFGKVNDVVIMIDQQRKRSRGFGFLTFESEDSVEQICKMHYVNIGSKKVECKKAEPREIPTVASTTRSAALQGCVTLTRSSGGLLPTIPTTVTALQGSPISPGLIPSTPISPEPPQSVARLPLLGSYVQELSSYGPARAFFAADFNATTGIPAAAATPLTYATQQNFAGINFDLSQGQFCMPVQMESPTMVATRTAALVQGYHPYRR